VILAVEGDQHFVLPDLVADQDIYLSVYFAESYGPTIPGCGSPQSRDGFICNCMGG
jgi:hypothetical protein